MIHGMSTSAQEQEAKSFIFQAFGYDIENINLLHVALDLSQAAAHKRLALLGDAALRAAALDEWYATPNSIGTIGALVLYGFSRLTDVL